MSFILFFILLLLLLLLFYFIFFTFLQTHLPIICFPANPYHASTKQSFIFFFFFFFLYFPANSSTNHASNKQNFFILFLFYTFLQTHLPIIYFPANLSTNHACSSRIYQTEFNFFFYFPVNLSTHHLLSCKLIYPSRMLIYAITKQSFIFLLSSPLVRIMAAPSRTRRRASPRLRQPQTKGIRKLCLLMWFSSSATVRTSLSSKMRERERERESILEKMRERLRLRWWIFRLGGNIENLPLSKTHWPHIC